MYQLTEAELDAAFDRADTAGMGAPKRPPSQITLRRPPRNRGPLYTLIGVWLFAIAALFALRYSQQFASHAVCNPRFDVGCRQ